MSSMKESIGKNYRKDVEVIAETESIGFAITCMTKNRFRRLPIVDAKNSLIGILSASDLLKAMYDKGDINFLQEKVSTIMASEVSYVTPDEDIIDVIDLMYNTSIGGVPILQDKQLVGIFTEKDIILHNDLWFKIHDEFITEDSGIGRPIIDKHIITHEYTIWQAAGMFLHLGQRQMLIRDPINNQFKGLMSVMKILETLTTTLIIENKDIPSLQTTSVDSLTYSPLLQKGVPILVNSVRLWMNSRGIEAVPLFHRGQPVKLVTEKDLLGFLYSQLVA